MNSLIDKEMNTVYKQRLVIHRKLTSTCHEESLEKVFNISKLFQNSHVFWMNSTALIFEDLTANVKIGKQIREYIKLAIYETLTLRVRKPGLNRQIDNFVNPPKLFARGGKHNPARLHAVDNTINGKYPARDLVRHEFIFLYNA